ncbi:hypothetical protein D1872_305980 [compost metagenome]
MAERSIIVSYFFEYAVRRTNQNWTVADIVLQTCKRGLIMLSRRRRVVSIIIRAIASDRFLVCIRQIQAPGSGTNYGPSRIMTVISEPFTVMIN